MTYSNWESASTENHLSRHKNRHDYKIYLNFLPIEGNIADFTVYRKKRAEDQALRPRGDMNFYRLPVHPNDDENWAPYWVTIEEDPNLEAFKASAKMNHYLTCQILFWSLKTAAKKVLPDKKYRIPNTGFVKEVSFILQEHNEGNEELIVQAYHLRSTQQFGYLVDFHFRLRDGIPFSRRIQQLSLSLDNRFRRNFDYYVDRSAKIREFIDKSKKVFDALRLPGCEDAIPIAKDFTALSADRLTTKVYQFAGNRESKSQFTGLRDHGPLRPLESPLKVLFIFREQDRQAARRLAMNLRGTESRNRFTFPGFNALFKCTPTIARDPVILPDLSQSSIEKALLRSKDDMDTGNIVIPILILPNDDDSYLVQKALFSHAKIASQVCTLRVLQDETSLKWAIANIALQVFCKAGGYPWKVRPTMNKSLIIGVSQSHKHRELNGCRSVEKYFAFSVMNDNSGLFQKIRVLGEGENQDRYIDELRTNLREVLKQNAQDFERIVIHTSFKLKRREMYIIEKTVREVAQENRTSCRFAVVKVNYKSRFFGVNRDVNSLVPYEATKVKLGHREYLVWFEGIYPDKTTVRKAFPGPTHLQILHMSQEDDISDEDLLQDLVNLSGANWRGFNAKSSPASVFYCHLVASLVHDFHERNLPLPAIEDIRPWFL